MPSDVKSFKYESKRNTGGSRIHEWRGVVNGDRVVVSIEHSVTDPFGMQRKTYSVNAFAPEVGSELGVSSDLGEYGNEEPAIEAAVSWMRRRSD